VSIERVYDDFEGWSGEVSINPNTLRPEGTFDRAMCVEFSADDATFKPITALYANGLPRPWDPIGPDYPFTYCIGYGSIKMDGPKLVRIVVRYKIWEDPLAIPIRKEWGIIRNSDVLERGCKPGHPAVIMPVRNSALEPPDPPMMTDYYDLVLRMTHNRAAFDPHMASKFMGSVNSDPFFGFPTGKVKCTLYTAPEDRSGGLIFYPHSFEFQIRTFESDPLNVGWLRRFKDEGFRELRYVVDRTETNETGGTTTTWKWEYQDILSVVKNEDGSFTKKPVSAGRAIPPTEPGHEPPDHYIEIQDYDQLPFSVLGLE
jgi:hypothetical protein